MISVKKFFVRIGHLLIVLGTLTLIVLYRLLEHLVPHEYELTNADQLLILLVAVLVAGAMHHQRISLEELVKDLTPRFEGLIRDIKSSGITKVRDFPDLSHYLVERFLTVKKGVKIIDSRPAKSGQWSGDYIKARDKLLSKGKGQERIVLIDSRDDLKKVVALMNKHAKEPLAVKYLTRADQRTVFSLLIIDENQVHFGQGFLGDPDGKTKDVELRSRQVVVTFISYFDQLWGKAHDLKTLEDGIKTAEVARLEREFEESEQPKLAVSVYGRQSYKMLCELTRTARTIEVISFPKLMLESEDRFRYYDTLRELIIEGARHRRIIWNGDQVKFVQEWFDKYPMLCTADGLEIRFCRPQPNEPLFYFDLLDQHTVVFAQDLIGDQFVQTRDPEFARMMATYFDHKWALAANYIIKTRDAEPNMGLLNSLATEFTE
jgi:hypothetical protein